MNRYRLSVLLLAPLACAAVKPPPELQKAIHATLYRMQRDGEGYDAVNQRQDLRMRFTGERSEFVYRGSRFGLALVGEGPVLRSSAQGQRVRFQHARVTEWFVNEAPGLEQGFTIASRRGARLALTLDTDGDLQPHVEGGEIVFRNGARTLRYGELKSWDANGRPLPSRAVVEGRGIRIEVDDTGARYPVTIDPVVQQAVLVEPAGSSGNNSDLFSSVALSGDGNTALLGNPYDVTAYLFTRSGSVWTLQQHFIYPNANPLLSGFGNAVALNGDGSVAIVAANGENMGTGGIYVYRRSASVWSQPQRLVSSTGANGDSFGQSVSLSSDGATALVGAPYVNSESGAAYLFTYANNAWAQGPVLDSNFVTTEFGYSVALSGEGTTAVVGAPLGTTVYVFTRSLMWARPQLLNPADNYPTGNFGVSLASSNDGTTLLIGASEAQPGGAGYVFTGSSSMWTQTQKLIAADDSTEQLGRAAALSADGKTAILGDPSTASAYLYTLSGTNWSQQQKLDLGNSCCYGTAVALSADGSTALVGDYQEPNTAYVYALQNISLASLPPGRSITVSGAGCPAGTYVTPYIGYWSGPCGVQWDSPDLSTSGTRYTFQNWYDGGMGNPRTVNPQPLGDPSLVAFTADFLTAYQLTTTTLPSVGGQVSPPSGTWFTAGTDAQVVAAAGPGYVFTGFSGALTGETSPQILTMTGPLSVTSVFTATPGAAASTVIAAKSGPANARQWTINVTNNGPGVAYNGQLVGLTFLQTYGTPCTALPLRDTPALPVALGDLAVNAGVQVPVTLDFSQCPVNARFTVTIVSVSNGGSSAGLVQLVNQFQ